MTASTSVVFVLAFAVLAVLGVAVARRSSGKMADVFGRLAAELDGQVSKPFGGYPILTFPLDDLEATASAISGGGRNRAHTFVHFYLPWFPARSAFVIASRGLRLDKMGLWRYRAVEVGVPSFDEAFIVRSEDEGFVRSLLTEGLRSRLMKVDERHVVDVVLGDAPSLEGRRWVDRPRLSISIRGVATGHDDYRMLIDAATAFHTRLRQIDAGAVESRP